MPQSCSFFCLFRPLQHVQMNFLGLGIRVGHVVTFGGYHTGKLQTPTSPLLPRSPRAGEQLSESHTGPVLHTSGRLNQSDTPPKILLQGCLESCRMAAPCPVIPVATVLKPGLLFCKMWLAVSGHQKRARTCGRTFRNLSATSRPRTPLSSNMSGHAKLQAASVELRPSKHQVTETDLRPDVHKPFCNF